MTGPYDKIIDNNAGLLEDDEEGAVAEVFEHYSQEAIDDLTEPTFRMDIGSGWLFFSGFRENKAVFENLLEGEVLSPVTDDEDWGTEAPIRVVMGSQTSRYTRRVLLDLVMDELSRYNDDTIDLLRELVTNDLIEFRTLEDRTFHPKVYNFYLQSKYPDDIWAGSANFSSGGLRQNIELCVPMQTTRKSRKRFRSWFDSLWEVATAELDVLETIDDVQTPAQLYHGAEIFFSKLIKSLNKYYLLEDAPGVEEDHLLEFQDLTYTIVMNRLQKFGGYILANSVGTGKTYVSAQTAATYLKLNPTQRVLAVIPANEEVQREWRDVLKQFGIWDRVDLESIGEFQKQNWAGDTSGRSESRIFDEREYADTYSLIIADEAHAYRNDGSNRRQNLRAVIKKNPDADVLLSTATPVNLSPNDLFQLVELFRNGRRSERFAESGLRETYVSARENLQKLDDYNDFSQELLQQIQHVEQELSIKMTWRVIQSEYHHDLQELAGETIEYEDPDVEEIEYNYPTTVRTNVFDEIVPFLESLNYESAKIWSDEGYQESKNLIFLQKWRLYKQLESSLPAFQEAVKRLYARNKIYYDTLSNVASLDESTEVDIDVFADGRSEIEVLLGDSGVAEITGSEEHSRRENMLETFTELSGEKKRQVLTRLEEDVDVTKRMLDAVTKTAGDKDAVPRRGDTKFESLVDLVADSLDSGSPVLIFSEHIATVEYLDEALSSVIPEHADRISHIHGSTGESKKDFVERFQSGEIDIVVSTEILAEGVNMPRADIVVNYDLPYNPTKLVQRAGRALRITNPKKIEIKNFTPDAEVDKELDLYDTLDARLDSIIQVAGLDFIVWMMDEKRVETVHEEERSEYLSHLAEYKDQIGRENPEEMANSESPPEETRTDRILRRAIETHNIDQELVESVTPMQETDTIFTTLEPATKEQSGELSVIGRVGGQTQIWSPLQESIKANLDAPERYEGLRDGDKRRIENLEEEKRREMVREQTAAGSMGRASSQIQDRVRDGIDQLSDPEMVGMLESVHDAIRHDSFTQSDLNIVEQACQTVLDENYSWMKDADSLIKSTAEWEALEELMNELETERSSRVNPTATGIIKYQNETMESK